MEYYREACQESGLPEDAKREDFSLKRAMEKGNKPGGREGLPALHHGSEGSYSCWILVTPEKLSAASDMAETGKIPKRSGTLPHRRHAGPLQSCKHR